MIYLCRVGGHDFMLGPHWYMLVLTYSIIIGIAACVDLWALVHRNAAERAVGLVLTGIVLILLTMLAFNDPGVVPESKMPLASSVSSFCERCQSYRPQGAIHCNDCGVCIEGYDHHCLYTSKCIGSKNIMTFHAFLTLMFVLMLYDGIEIILVINSDS